MSGIFELCEVMATIVETGIILDFLTKLLGKKHESHKQLFFGLISFFIINTYMICVSYIFPEYSALSDIIVLILYVVYAVTCTNSNKILQIITPAITISVISAVNLSLLSFLAFIFNCSVGDLVTGRNTIRILILVLTKFIFFILTRFVIKRLKPKEIVLNSSEYLAIALSFLCSVIIILYFAEYQFHSTNDMFNYITIVVLISVVLINVASTILFVMLVKHNRENTKYMMIQVQFNEQKKLHQSICSAYKSLEILQHDMKNDMLVLQSLVHQNKVAEAEHFIESYTKTKLETFRIYVNTGVEMIDAILNIKLNYAKERGIDVLCHIAADFNSFKTEDIVSLFSNAIDNAIESSVQQEKKFITISITNKRNYLCITIGNAIDESVLKNNKELVTTKKDKHLHGFGKQSMQKIVDSYDGMMDYYETDGIFYAEMLLKSTKQEAKTTK